MFISKNIILAVIQHYKIVCLKLLVLLNKLILISTKFSGYGIGFDEKGEFLFGNGFGKNLIIFGADMSSSFHANNKTKNILVLGKDFIQGLDNTTIYAEKFYSVNFNKTNTKFCLSLYLMEQTVICLSMAQKFINLKQNILRL